MGFSLVKALIRGNLERFDMSVLLVLGWEISWYVDIIDVSWKGEIRHIVVECKDISEKEIIVRTITTLAILTLYS